MCCLDSRNEQVRDDNDTSNVTGPYFRWRGHVSAFNLTRRSEGVCFFKNTASPGTHIRANDETTKIELAATARHRKSVFSASPRDPFETSSYDIISLFKLSRSNLENTRLLTSMIDHS